jgi:hypothetical protein
VHELERNRKTSVSLISVPAEVRTDVLPNKILDLYHYTTQLGQVIVINIF